MKTYQSRSFEKKIKKMSSPEKDSLDRASRELLSGLEAVFEKPIK
jgi:hypothetical protein